MKKQELGQYYNQVKQELDMKLESANKLLSEIQAKLNETETNREQSAKSLTSLTENYQQVVTLINQTQTDLTQIAELRTQALDPTTGVAQIVTRLSAIEESADTTASKIEELRKSAVSYEQATQKYNEESRKAWESVNGSNTKAENILKNLQKTYELAVNTGLAGSFDKRKKDVNDEFVEKWSMRFNVSLSFLGIIAAIILAVSWLSNNFTLEILVFFRLALLTPIVFYTGYCALQYGRERRLLEKYAFKAAIASSLESYTTILSNSFGSDGENDQRILGFVLDSMNIIYSEPHEDIKKRSYGFSLGNKLAQAKSEIVEEIGDEVKKIIGEK
jgi:hypothetical protein